MLISKLLHLHSFKGVLSLCWHGCVVLSQFLGPLNSRSAGSGSAARSRGKTLVKRVVPSTGNRVFYRQDHGLTTQWVRLPPSLFWQFHIKIFMESPLAPLKLRIQVFLFRNFYGAPPSHKILVQEYMHGRAKKNCFWLLDRGGAYIHVAVVKWRLNALQLWPRQIWVLGVS